MSNPINDGGPAFPTKHEVLDPRAVGWTMQEGMSLRDYFATKAMEGLISRVINPCSTGNTNLKWAEVTEDPVRGAKWLASDAYKIADAMLAERQKTQP